MNTITLKKIALIILLSIMTSSIVLNAQSNESAALDSQEQKKQAIIIDYLVQEGDTLAGLTTQYLGDSTLWSLNADVNPQISNFNSLKPGTTIRLITGYKAIDSEVETAQVKIASTTNQVGKNLQRSDWLHAAAGDELQANYGIRTQAESSALIIFIENTGSESRVHLNEKSRIFISKEKQESGINRNKIGIEKGEAELKIDSSAVNNNATLNEFEIIVGKVKTTPVIGATAQLSTKARLAGTDTAQIMVYSGSSVVESGGESVEVETGMGTIAKSGDAPSSPEKLLAASKINTDNPKTTSVDQNPIVQWSALENAASYKLELCKDSSCTQIFRTKNALTEAKLALSDLPLGISYWRVSGISASGLDGFATEAHAITVSELLPEPPEPEAQKIPWYIWLIGLIYILIFVKIFYWYITR